MFASVFDVRRRLQRWPRMRWSERGNLYREGATSVVWCVGFTAPRATFPLAGNTPANWSWLWNDPQAKATEGRLRERAALEGRPEEEIVLNAVEKHLEGAEPPLNRRGMYSSLKASAGTTQSARMRRST